MMPAAALHYNEEAVRILRDAGSRYGAESDIFCRPQWIETWLKHFQGRETLVALSAYEGDRLVFVLPLLLRSARWHGVPVQELHTCTNGHSPSAAAIVASSLDPLTLEVVARHLVKDTAWDLFTCLNVRESQSELLHVCESIRRLRKTLQFDEGRHIILTELEERKDYLAERSVKFRQQLQKTKRELAHLGSHSVEIFTGINVAQGFEHFLEVDARSWKAKDGETVAGNRELEDFYSGLLQYEALNGAVYVLKAGETLISASIGFRSNVCAYGLKISSVADFETSKCSPGKLLLATLIGYLHGTNIKKFEFLNSAPFYHRFSDQNEAIVSYRTFNDTLSGRTAFMAEKILSGRSWQREPPQPRLEVAAR